MDCIAESCLDVRRTLSELGATQGPHMRSGIYILMYGEQVQYVGKSGDIQCRVEQHKRQRRIPFDKYFFVFCGPEELDLTERLMCVALKPKQNKNLKGDLTIREMKTLSRSHSGCEYGNIVQRLVGMIFQ